MDTEFLTIGAVSERTGVAPSALRFYEGEAFIHATRSDGGQRRFSRDTVRRARSSATSPPSAGQVPAISSTTSKGVARNTNDWSTMARQVVEVHAEAAATPDAVWQLLTDVTTWTDWARFDEADYERKGEATPHGLGAVRRFRVRRLRSRETVLVFDPPAHFAYDYVGTLPIKDYRADVTLSQSGPGTRITWHSEFTAKVPLTGPLLRAMLARVLQDLADRLARAAEAAASG